MGGVCYFSRSSNVELSDIKGEFNQADKGGFGYYNNIQNISLSNSSFHSNSA